MAIPRVFISSTWYDLRYIRENIKYLIRTIGYEPVLSEEGKVFYNPRSHVQDACIAEIPNCQMFVLIIGGRFGAKFKDTEKSITNTEYNEAVRLKIPIFAVVEAAVYNDFQLYQANLHNNSINLTKIHYPSTDSIKIFDFLDQVRSNTVNNAAIPFRDFADIEAYLRQQWAGMMCSYLLGQNEETRVCDTLAVLQDMSARVEMLSRQILGSVGTKTAKLTAELYDEMLRYECVRDLAYMGARPTPKAILANDSFHECVGALKIAIGISEEKESLVGMGWMSRPRFEDYSKSYRELREALLKRLKTNNLSLDMYLKDPEVV